MMEFLIILLIYILTWPLSFILMVWHVRNLIGKKYLIYERLASQEEKEKYGLEFMPDEKYYFLWALCWPGYLVLGGGYFIFNFLHDGIVKCFEYFKKLIQK